MRSPLIFLFSHRLLAIGRWDIHFILLRAKNWLTGQRTKVQRFVANRSNPVLLNFGSGPRGLDNGHWVNIDGFTDRNVHFTVDFNRPLPLADRSVDGVFCEHVMEHFSLEDGQKIAREIQRTLKPGGVFRVIVPDASKIIQAYLDDPSGLAKRRGEGTAMGAVNSYFRQRYEHQFLYDWETMRQMLLAAGFSSVEHLRYNESKSSLPLVLDDQKYAWESLYVEAKTQELGDKL